MKLGQFFLQLRSSGSVIQENMQNVSSTLANVDAILSWFRFMFLKGKWHWTESNSTARL